MLKVFLLLICVPLVLPEKPCRELHKLHYKCQRLSIDSETQQPTPCAQNGSTFVWCRVAPGIKCDGLHENGSFYNELRDACDPNVHIQHSTALLLSIFLGVLGIDRFYLGYYAIGVLKLFSLGGLFVLWLADIILIALNMLGPADGSTYIMPYFGPKAVPFRSLNQTLHILDL